MAQDRQGCSMRRAARRERATIRRKPGRAFITASKGFGDRTVKQKSNLRLAEKRAVCRTCRGKRQAASGKRSEVRTHISPVRHGVR